MEEEEEKEEVRTWEDRGRRHLSLPYVKRWSTDGKNYLLPTAGGEPTSHTLDQPRGGKTCTS